MHSKYSTCLPLLLAAIAALTPAALRADPADDFLSEIETIEAAESRKKAIAMLEGALASGRFGSGASHRLNSRLASLMVREGRAADAAGILTGPLAAGAPAALILPPAREYVESSSEKSLFRKQATLQALLDSRPFAAKGADRADLLRLLASVYSRRSFCDLELAALKEAASCQGDGDPARDADLLEALAANAIARDDLAMARQCYKRLQSLHGIHYSRARRAQLAEARSYIHSSRFRWAPSPGDLDTAGRSISEAIGAKPRAITAEEAFAAQFDLMRAFGEIGLLDSALDLALKLSAYPADEVRPSEIAPAMFEAAEIYAAREDWRNSQRFYKKAQDSGYKSRKVLCYKLATAARRNGDITASIQALTDAISCCDPVEGKKEIASLRRQIGNLSKAIRDKVKETSADDIFGNTSDELGAISLDEE